MSNPTDQERIATLEAEVVAQRNHIKALISLIVATPETTAPFNDAVRASNREAASSNDDAFKAAMPDVLRKLQTHMKRA